MPKFTSQLESIYTPVQLRDLIIDVESYPKFVPGCSAVKIIEVDNNIIFADMVVSFKSFVESYRSRIEIRIDRPEKVEVYVEAISGPFEYLTNSWCINKHNKSTIIDFSIDFSFKSPILNKLIGSVLKDTTLKMLSAFENRAKSLFEN